MKKFKNVKKAGREGLRKARSERQQERNTDMDGDRPDKTWICVQKCVFKCVVFFHTVVNGD